MDGGVSQLSVNIFPCIPRPDLRNLVNVVEFDFWNSYTDMSIVLL